MFKIVETIGNKRKELTIVAVQWEDDWLWHFVLAQKIFCLQITVRYERDTILTRSSLWVA